MKPTSKILLSLALMSSLTASGFAAVPSAAAPQTTSKNTFATGDKTFLLNGKPFVVKAAEIHYPRIPRQYWEHRIKMCKALGMNTICIYIFWNIHEQREGVYDFSGQNDVAEFCRLAKKNGMYVIVRPGPYVCAEWEMGGLPWWLLKKKDIRLREQDPYFMSSVDRFEKKVAEQLAPLTIQRGGPIIMVQVENEYGSYGEDKAYVSDIRDTLRKYWDTSDAKTTLFQCDWNSNFEKNGLDDLTWTMNFGTGANIDDQFRRLRELRPNAPLMCSEFWSGWFDKWGARHETRPAKDMVDGIDEMLSKGISFSLYMTHGGTSFGHWAGANSPGFAPDVTSYDYDAPINEYGAPTEKYWLLRKTLQKYADGKLPAVPGKAADIISIPKMTLQNVAPIYMGVDSTAESRDVQTFEEMNMGYGSMIYNTELPEISEGSMLHIDGHDFVQVFVGGKYVGKIDRVKNERSLPLPATKKGDVLTLLVEGMGRINFGRAIKDFKGLVGDVTLTADVDGDELTWNLKDWRMRRIADDYQTARRAMTTPHDDVSLASNTPSAIGYYKATFKLKKTGDTFLNMETWGKGQVYVNGHALGRFWSIGPQQTLYCPGCWLKKGENEIVVLDVVGPKQPVVWGQNRPELDKLQLEKSAKHNNIGDKPDLNSATPVAKGETKSGNGWQTIGFNAAATGRYVAIECPSTHDGKPVAIAELYLQGADGKRLSRDGWDVKYADSENLQGNHTGDKAFDLQESTYWQTEREAASPHLLVIDMGTEQTVKALEYLPRMEQGAPGSVKEYKVYVY
ncbi:beta-galactosidase [Prevotella sp.]|uniref:beta-galactosidase n=1 Tax=Prevotella sp. TaxID=59823 RepID=UPI0025CFD013|nr:beta-galactosidase [Prevotella sp.]